MFGHGLESLLRQETQFEIVGQEAEIDQAIDRFVELDPDVVIFDSDDVPNNSTPTVLRILKEKPDVKVVGLNLHQNTVYVYEAKQWLVKEVKDLVLAIQKDSTLIEARRLRPDDQI
jgi:DNA-binding NarL/FixJ family response regulator